MSGLLEGKVIFVSGGASGIGRAAALLFAREGAAVALGDRDETRGREVVALITEAGGRAAFLPLDVTSDPSVRAAVEGSVVHFGRLDGAFNNAGVAGEHSAVSTGKLADLAESTWQAILDVNVSGVWRCMKYQIRHMLAQGSGSIVNNASIAGLVGIGGQAAYVASKHGVVGLTKAAAIEYSRQGLRINTLCPGFVVTPMTDAVLKQAGDSLLARVPARRHGLPGEIAEAAVWLLSDRSSFVTGSEFVVDGGFTAQ